MRKNETSEELCLRPPPLKLFVMKQRDMFARALSNILSIVTALEQF